MMLMMIKMDGWWFSTVRCSSRRLHGRPMTAAVMGGSGEVSWVQSWFRLGLESGMFRVLFGSGRDSGKEASTPTCTPSRSKLSGVVDQLRTRDLSTEQSKGEPLGANHWNLLSGRLEWSWVDIHGIAIQD
ncbi:hypothetical protein Hanom_Chr12g01092731 [Helianthus anomalus]